MSGLKNELIFNFYYHLIVHENAQIKEDACSNIKPS